MASREEQDQRHIEELFPWLKVKEQVVRQAGQEGQQITLDQFLRATQIQQAWEIWEECEQRAGWLLGGFAKRCEKEVIEPNIGEIQTKLGQQCHSRYLAYCVEYVFTQVSRQNQSKQEKLDELKQ